jgi:queuine tRNA-ribosyltransferase
MEKFKFRRGVLDLPIFFPDATRGVVRGLDFSDVENAGIEGVLVNSYHLMNDLSENFSVSKKESIGDFMGWKGAIISDSGGFQVNSLVRYGKNAVEVKKTGVIFKKSNKKIFLTPEKSIRYQLALKTDLVVVLDDFGTPGEDKLSCKKVVERTLNWARKAKDEYERITKNIKKHEKPYLIGVVQGGDYEDLRVHCTQKLIEIGFDGLGLGGWDAGRDRMVTIGKLVAGLTPKNYLLYGLGVGKPDDIRDFYLAGYKIFDCVIPTRDARHGRLFVYNAASEKKIDVREKNFYELFYPFKSENRGSNMPVSELCDCLLCKKYTRGYLYHLHKINDYSYYRLSTIHNLRFYSKLMKYLRKIKT